MYAVYGRYVTSGDDNHDECSLGKVVVAKCILYHCEGIDNYCLFSEECSIVPRFIRCLFFLQLALARCLYCCPPDAPTSANRQSEND